MTDPVDPNVETAEENVEGEVHVNEHTVTDSDSDNKRYIVKTQWHTHSLTGENHPEVTPAGVEMSATERAAAYETAKQAHVKLKSKEASS